MTGMDPGGGQDDALRGMFTTAAGSEKSGVCPAGFGSIVRTFLFLSGPPFLDVLLSATGE